MDYEPMTSMIMMVFCVVASVLSGCEQPHPVDECRSEIEELCAANKKEVLRAKHGDRVAAEVAHRHADRLRSLWLLAPAGAEGERPSEMIEGFFAGEGVPLFARTPAEYTASIQFTMRRPPAIPKPALRVLAAESAAAYDHTVQVFVDMTYEFATGATTEELLDGLPIPTLLTWGDADRVLHPSGADSIAAVLPDATVHLMPEVGHLPMMEDPTGTARDGLAFLDRVGA